MCIWSRIQIFKCVKKKKSKKEAEMGSKEIKKIMEKHDCSNNFQEKHLGIHRVFKRGRSLIQCSTLAFCYF